MKISGVDTRVVEQVKDQVTQPVVRKTLETRITREYKEQERDQEQHHGDARDRMRRSVEQLNRVYSSFKSPVRFRLVEEDEESKVQVLDIDEERVIKEVEPEKVMSAVTQVEKLLGLMVDTLI